jgi:cytosine/adenosine deaminase-related metal-dependent hydrolase
MRNACGGLQKLYDTFAINVADWQPEVNQNYVLSSGKQLLVHSVYCNEDDHTMLAADTNKYVCLCPNANIFIGNDLPNVYALAKYNKQICLGTDSYASNNNLSIVEEIKTLRHFFPKLGLETLLRWATSNGADALGISNLYGSLEAGMPAKYVVLDKSLAQYST